MRPPSHQRLLQTTRKTVRAFWQLTPVLVGVLLLAGLVVQIIPQLIQQGWLGHGGLLELLSATLIGSLAAGQPVVSYILGGELQQAGVALVAVTAFITAWVTVGIVPLPAEAAALGWRFALWRNALAFLFSMLIAWLTVTTLQAWHAFV